MRIVRDAAAKLRVEPKDLFTMAVAMHQRTEDPAELYSYYQTTDTIPHWLCDYLVDILVQKEKKVAVPDCPADLVAPRRVMATRKAWPEPKEDEAA